MVWCDKGVHDTLIAYSGSCVDAMPEAFRSIVSTQGTVCCGK